MWTLWSCAQGQGRNQAGNGPIFAFSRLRASSPPPPSSLLLGCEPDPTTTREESAAQLRGPRTAPWSACEALQRSSFACLLPSPTSGGPSEQGSPGKQASRPAGQQAGKQVVSGFLDLVVTAHGTACAVPRLPRRSLPWTLEPWRRQNGWELLHCRVPAAQLSRPPDRPTLRTVHARQSHHTCTCACACTCTYSTYTCTSVELAQQPVSRHNGFETVNATGVIARSGKETPQGNLPSLSMMATQKKVV